MAPSENEDLGTDDPAAPQASEVPEPSAPPVASPPVTLARERSWRELAVEVGVVFSVTVLGSLVASISDLVWPQPSVALHPLASSLNRFFHAVPRIILVLYVIQRSGEPWSRFGLVRPRLWRDGALWLLTGLASFAQAPHVARLCGLLGIQHHRSAATPWPELLHPPAGVFEISMIAIGICASAFSEELVFRAYLIPRLASLTRSSVSGLLLSSLLFGFLHLYQSTEGMISTGLSGLLWGLVFCLTRRIWPIFLAHAVGNLWINFH